MDTLTDRAPAPGVLFREVASEMRRPRIASASTAARTVAPAGAPGGEQVAYLINTYPRVSHSFISTEIASLERQGLKVSRFSFRRAEDHLDDSRFASEVERTVVLLECGALQLAMACAACFASQPGATAGALWLALRSNGPARVVQSIAQFAEAALLSRKLRQAGLRHVHAHFGTNSTAVARLAARLAPVTYSFTVHGPEEFDSPVGLDLPGKIGEAAFVATVSSFGRGQLMRWSEAGTWDRIRVVRCGAAQSFFEGSIELADDAPARLLCVARLDTQKGLPLLIDAVAQVAARRDVVVEIFGDGPGRAGIEAQIARLGLEPNVRLLGWGTPEAIRRRLKEVRAFVLPSFAEGLPVVLMEALAQRRPVIATRVAGIPELVDQEVGWLISSGSVDAIADAIDAALDASPDELRAMGERGRARVLTMHHPDSIAAELAALLKPLL